MPKVLIACDMPDSFLEGLRQLGYEVTYHPDASSTEVLTMVEPYSGLVISTKTLVGKEIIDAGKNLRFIARAGSGMEIIDRDYANTKGIATLNSPEGNCDAVGEHALGMLLSLFNNLNRADRQVRDANWIREPNRGVEIKGKTISIIGYGHTGMAFAKKLAGFEARVLAYDKYKRNFSDAFVQEGALDEIYREADILSLHVPLTAETKHMINAATIARFTKSFYLVNTARGGVINTDDVVIALQSGKILGACLDVLEDEIEYQRHDWFKHLAAMDNVILSPHIAGWTRESRERIGEVLLGKIKALE